MGEKVPDYDFMGDSSDRQRTYQEIMAYYATNVSQRGGDGKLLLDDAGQIDQRTYRRDSCGKGTIVPLRLRNKPGCRFSGRSRLPVFDLFTA